MKSPNGVTLARAAEILSALERRPITASQVRSILVLDSHARAMSPLPIGTARIFTVTDLAVARLVLRLRAQGVSPVVSRVVVANWRDHLIEIWRHRRPMALAVIGMRGLLLWRGKEPEGAAAWVDLPAIWQGISRLMKTTHAEAKQQGQTHVHTHA